MPIISFFMLAFIISFSAGERKMLGQKAEIRFSHLYRLMMLLHAIVICTMFGGDFTDTFVSERGEGEEAIKLFGRGKVRNTKSLGNFYGDE